MMSQKEKVYNFKEKLKRKEEQRREILKNQLLEKLVQLKNEIGRTKGKKQTRKLEMTREASKELLERCQIKFGQNFEELEEVDYKEIELYNRIVSRCLGELKKEKQEQQKIKNSWKEPGE